MLHGVSSKMSIHSAKTCPGCIPGGASLLCPLPTVKGPLFLPCYKDKKAKKEGRAFERDNPGWEAGRAGKGRPQGKGRRAPV